MYARSSSNIGLNTKIALESTSQSQSSQHITNNIIVKGEGTEPIVVERSVTVDPEAKTAEQVVTEPQSVDSILLEIYKSILLHQNKTLLANILSKKHIIIYKEDLERVISAKIGKRVAVVLHEKTECGCTLSGSPFSAIESIVVYENDKRVDFHVGYNADYVELAEKYALNLKIVAN